MLQNWITQNVLLYGMAAAGIVGLLCTLIVNHFYSRVVGDLRRIDVPKTKWMGQTLQAYRERARQNTLANPQIFVRNQLNQGKTLGMKVSRWQRGTGYMCLACFGLTAVAVYATYQYQMAETLRNQHLVMGLGVFLGLLLFRQFLGFAGKEQQIADGLLDYMENSGKLPVVSAQPQRPFEEKEKSALIDQVMQGIQQTAAAGSKFSGLLSKEEEQVMREVIQEYLT